MGIITINNEKYNAELIDDIQEQISILESAKSGYQKKIIELQNNIAKIDEDLKELKK